MKIDDLTKKMYDMFSKKDLSEAQGKLAIQFNVIGKPTGVFYAEILDGVLSVMPYEYIDRDAVVTASAQDYSDLLDGKFDITEAIATRKLKIEGNVDKLLVLSTLLQK